MDQRSGFVNKQSKRIISTPSPAARNAFFYIQEAGIIKTGDAESMGHRDNADSFLFAAVTKGRGEAAIAGERYSLNNGDCLFIDCRNPYELRSSDNDPWEIMWLHFNGATSAKYYEFFLSQMRNVFRTAHAEEIESVISEIISVNEKNEPEAEIITSSLIVKLLTLALTSNRSEDQTGSALRQKLSAVNRYIEEHFTEEITLEMLSSLFYISKYYLTREYKKIYGKTIFQHIITCRINCGKKLLRFSDHSVEEIAHLCGFNDQSYFARQFKKSENVTCFAYRKMWREK